MCLAVPGRIVWIGDPSPASIPGRVDAAGVLREVDLVMVPDAEVGDHVIVHAGYAVRRAREVRPDDPFWLGPGGGGD
ncbi:MAG TPA: HypC/HybG/HupF family hydrogenase formation chaperone [Acidimicrobiia bacterium]|jgi:hydrogenase expression/formation protein HypC